MEHWFSLRLSYHAPVATAAYGGSMTELSTETPAARSANRLPSGVRDSDG